MDVLAKLKRLDPRITFFGIPVKALADEIEYLRMQNETQRALIQEMVAYPRHWNDPETAEKTGSQKPSGKITNVLVEDYIGTSGNITGATIWADAGLREVIESVEGVKFVVPIHDTEYSIYYDRRYDPNIIKKNILTAVRGPGQEWLHYRENSRSKIGLMNFKTWLENNGTSET